ncbi:transposase [Novipirellula galeiformis]|uniref:transposase n=1 Tax=Novipirellula galeiformis TaxID=2528004 RepID=UPI0018CE1D93|nr:transposase [Novipirellula galeiformis]
MPFQTQIIKHHKRRESSVNEVLLEMCLAGVSVRRAEDITESRGGTHLDSINGC